MFIGGTTDCLHLNVFAVSAPPDDVKTDEVDETAEAVGNMTGDVTVTKEEETVQFSLRLSDGELTVEEAGNLSSSMAAACGDKPIEKIKVQTTDEDNFKKMASGEIVVVPDSLEKRNKFRQDFQCNDKKVNIPSKTNLGL